MSTWYKQGVYGDLTREASEGLRKTEKLYHKYSIDLFITSVRDGSHSPGSLHPSGNAWDQRKGLISVKEHRDILGADFDVVDEGNHRHVEYDPKCSA